MSTANIMLIHKLMLNKSIHTHEYNGYTIYYVIIHSVTLIISENIQ